VDVPIVMGMLRINRNRLRYITMNGYLAATQDAEGTWWYKLIDVVNYLRLISSPKCGLCLNHALDWVPYEAHESGIVVKLHPECLEVVLEQISHTHFEREIRLLIRRYGIPSS
jgi:hypothetical protein